MMIESRDQRSLSLETSSSSFRKFKAKRAQMFYNNRYYCTMIVLLSYCYCTLLIPGINIQYLSGFVTGACTLISDSAL